MGEINLPASAGAQVPCVLEGPISEDGKHSDYSCAWKLHEQEIWCRAESVKLQTSLRLSTHASPVSCWQRAILGFLPAPTGDQLFIIRSSTSFKCKRTILFLESLFRDERVSLPVNI